MASRDITSKCAPYDQACIEARKWIEEVTEKRFPSDDFRSSLCNGVLLCKLAEKLSGINIGELNPIPRSLAWMDNLTIFLNICRFIGLEKSQLFHVDDLAAVRNRDLPAKIKLQEESRKIRNVLITIYWLAKLSYTLETYEGPLPDLNAFEILINQPKPAMANQQLNKFDLSFLSSNSGGASTWPRLKRKSEEPGGEQTNEGSSKFSELTRKDLKNKVKEKASMYDKIQSESNEDYRYQRERRRSDSTPLSSAKLSEKDGFIDKTQRSRSLGVLEGKKYERFSTSSQFNSSPQSYGSITGRSPVKVAHVQNKTDKFQIRRSSSPVKPRQNNYDLNVARSNVRQSVHSGSNRGEFQRNRDKDYVSVTQLIQQWSNDKENEKYASNTKPNSIASKSNRRSLPSDFNVHKAQATYEDAHTSYRMKSSVMPRRASSDYPIKSTVVNVLSESSFDRERNGSRDTRLMTSEQRRRSEPVSTITKNASNIVQTKTVRSDELKRSQASTQRRSSNEEIRRSQGVREDLNEPKLDRRTSMDIKHESRRVGPQNAPVLTHNVSHPDNIRKQLEPSGIKYATLPARFRSNHKNVAVVRALETKTSEVGDEKIVWNDKPKENFKQGLSQAARPSNYTKQDFIHAAPPNKFEEQKRPPSQRRLPSYEEATQPLHDARSVNEEARVSEIQPVKAIFDNKSPRGYSEIPVKEKALTVKAAVELESSYTNNYLIGKSTKETIPVHGYHVPNKEPTSSVKRNEAYTSLYSGQHIFNKSTLDKPPLSNSRSHNISYIDEDINNNKVSAYDLHALESQLALEQREMAKDIAKDASNKSASTTNTQGSMPKKESDIRMLNERERLREQQKIILDEDFNERGRIRMAPQKVKEEVKISSVVHDDDLLKLVAAEEKYWKGKVERKDKVVVGNVKKQPGKVDEKQRRINEMLEEYKHRDQGVKVDYSEMTDTLRAEEEFLAQEAEKLLSERFQKKSIKTNVTSANTQENDMIDSSKHMGNRYTMNHEVKGQYTFENKDTFRNNAPVNSKPNIGVTPQQKMKPPSISGSDDVNLKPEADQAYHNMQLKKVSRSRSPVYICSGCHQPVQKDICLYVSELQSYWHEKCFCCSVCHCNLMRGRSTPKIRIMFSRIHCENCLSSKRSGGQSTMV